MSTYFTYIRGYIYNSRYFSRLKFANFIESAIIKGNRIPCFLLFSMHIHHMKKIILGGILMYVSLLVVWYAQMIVPDSQNYILNENDQQVLVTEDIKDPLRQGAYHVVSPEWWTTLSGIVSADQEISSHIVAQNRVMDVVKNIINYALWMIALVALVYLIYHGFIMVTAAGDDTQYKKGLKWIKYAAIAMVGVGMSWLIVSAIFWLIALLIWTST